MADDPEPRAAAGSKGRKSRVTAESLYPLLLIFLFIGLGAAIFAAFEVIDPSLTQVCSTSNSFLGLKLSCASVATSGHTTVLGIPDYAVGIIGYVVMIGVGIQAYRTWDRRYLKLLLACSLVGLLFIAYFVYEESFVIGAICPVCTTAHAANVGVLITTLTLLRMSRPDREAPAGP
jgi:uncharacterized membrane protein